MRTILEITFLIDLLESDRKLISTWRHAGEKDRKTKFSPMAVRTALDKRDGLEEQKRKEHYDLFNRLAAHPTMESMDMMRAQRTGNLQPGPFIEMHFLRNMLFEMARLALQFGNTLDRFFFETWIDGYPDRMEYRKAQKQWLDVNEPRIS